MQLCGRRLCETMLYWETVDANTLNVDQIKFRDIWKALPKVVFSTTLEGVVGNARVVRNGLADEVCFSRNSPERTGCRRCPTRSCVHEAESDRRVALVRLAGTRARQANLPWSRRNGCVFRTNVAPDSGAKWPPVPEEKSRVVGEPIACRIDMQ